MDFGEFNMRDNLKVVQNYEVEYNTTKTIKKFIGPALTEITAAGFFLGGVLVLYLQRLTFLSILIG